MTGIPTVAIFRSPVFNRSETFIRAQAALFKLPELLRKLDRAAGKDEA